MLDQAGYQGVAKYWINILHGGDVSQASPLLRAMLRSSGRNELRRNVAQERGLPPPEGLFSAEGDADDLVSSGAPVAQTQPTRAGPPLSPAQIPPTDNRLEEAVFN